MLTDEEIEKCREKAAASYKHHRSSIRGQQVTEADDPEMHLIWAVIAAYEAKLRGQEPVAWMQISVEAGVTTRFPRDHMPKKFNADWWRFEPLYTHPAPIPEGWQPIETAPKDCAFLGYQILIAKMWVIAPMYWSGSEFVLVQFHNDNTEHSMKPTHWQPIPKPPLAAARSGE